jgi:hypothetical protein
MTLNRGDVAMPLSPLAGLHGNPVRPEHELTLPFAACGRVTVQN